MELLSSVRCFDGFQNRYQHKSTVLGCSMVFSVYLPPAAKDRPVPVLLYLSGLTCTDENVVTKAGFQRYAAEHGVAVVAPDTSPRGEDVPDDPEGAYDFGLGAGFYVDATEAPWSRHYRMYEYVVNELPQVVAAECPVDFGRAGIFGHSMGGHGALVIGLRNPEKFKSISAFSPICSPSQCPWGQKALGNYLGPDEATWADYDASVLLASAEKRLPILVDQGDSDAFLKEQLKPEALEAAALKSTYPLTLRYQSGYDHSYYFISSFIGDHIAFHARHIV